MVKTIKFFILLLIVTVGCKSNNISVLEDGWTMIPNDSLFFEKHYRSVVDKNVGLPDLINPECIYIENYYLYGSKRKKFDRDDDVHRNIFRFYRSGAMNDFSMANPYTLSDPKLFDPNFRGKRGICYEKDDIWYIDLVGKSSEIKTIGFYCENSG